jgi:hypothetical protein
LEDGSTQAPLQTSFGAAQSTSHTPSLQASPAPQALPQAPQLFSSLFRSTQPPLQEVNPGWQTTPQSPPTQIGVAPGPEGQLLSHAPQCAGFELVSTQLPLHSC